MTRYAREYERLRSQVNGASPERPFASTPPLRGIGLALLLRDGLPAWIQAVQQVLSAAAASATVNAAAAPSHSPRASQPALSAAAGVGGGAPSSPGPLVEPARQRDLAALLASLVLSTRAAHAAAMKEPGPCH